MESRGHAPLDAAEQREGAEDRARAQRDRQYQQNRAHPPPAQVLQRQPEVEPSGCSRHVHQCLDRQRVVQRLFSKCSRFVGTITQSWWPPKFGKKPTGSRVSCVNTNRPHERR